MMFAAVDNEKQVSGETLDIGKIIERLQANKLGYEAVSDREIAFFLGKTGSGKTTTINYTAGRKMIIDIHKITTEWEGEQRESEEDVIDCEDPIEGFKIGHRPKSETAAVNVFDCPVSGLLLCDSPGGDDTEGKEVDISNAVGIYNTLVHARTVRLVLVLDGTIIPVNRGQVLRELLEQTNRFLVDARSHFSSIAVLFTKIKPHPTKLQNEFSKLGNESHIRSDPALHAFVRHLYGFVEKHKASAIVDPLAEEARGSLVSLIKNTTPLVVEPGLFTFDGLLPQKTRLILLEAVKGMIVSLQLLLPKFEFSRIRRLLDSVKLLCEEINMMPEISEVHAIGKNLLEKRIADLVVWTRNLLGSDFKAAKEGMELLRNALQLQDHLDKDVKELYREMQDVINTSVSVLYEEITKEESYLIISQKLASLKDMLVYLHPHLTEKNKTAYNIAYKHTQDCIDYQNALILQHIDMLRRGEDIYIGQEEERASLTDILARNLDQFFKVRNVEGRETLYQEKIVILEDVLKNCYHTCISGLSVQQLPLPIERIQASFKILRDVAMSRALIQHVPKVKDMHDEVAISIKNMMDNLRKNIEEHIFDDNYEPISEMVITLGSLLRIDGAIGDKFREDHWMHTISLLEKHIMNIINELKKKVSFEMLESKSSNGFAFINSKIRLLQSAKRIENVLPEKSLISETLAALKDTFDERVLKLTTKTADCLFKDNNFESTVQYIDQLSSLTVLRDFVPAIQAEFSGFCKKLEVAVLEVEGHVQQHFSGFAYRELAGDYHILQGYIRVANSITMGGLLDLEGVPVLFTGVLSKIKASSVDVITTFQSSWSGTFNKFNEELSLIDSAQEADKTSRGRCLTDLLKKLKSIKEANMDDYLENHKPTVEFEGIVKILERKVYELEVSTKSKIVQGQFEEVDKNLDLLKVIVEVCSSLDSFDAHTICSTLSSLARERKFNLSQEIPAKLQRQKFKDIGTILTSLRNSNTESDRNEYENSCSIVKEHFDALQRSLRWNMSEEVLRDVFAALDQFQRARVLDDVEPDFEISRKCETVSQHVRQFLDKRHKRFEFQLQRFKLRDSLYVLRELERYSCELPAEFMEKEKVIALRSQLDTFCRQLPDTVKQLLQSDVESIDIIANELELLGSNEEYEGEDIQNITIKIKKYLLVFVTEKDSEIKNLISAHDTVNAEKELAILASVSELKYLSSWKAKDTLKTRSEDLQSVKTEMFDKKLLSSDPTKLSEQLDIVRKHGGHSIYSQQVATLEKKLDTMEETISCLLDNIGTANQYTLRQLASHLETFKKSIPAFEQHPQLFYGIRERYDKMLAKLNAICSTMQKQLVAIIRAKQWGEVEQRLLVMKSVASELGEHVQKEFVAYVDAQNTTIKAVADMVQSTFTYFRKLDFLLPVDMDELNTNLSKIKENANAQYCTHIEADGDTSITNYADVVQMVINNLEKLSAAVANLWGEEKFQPISTLLQNLKQNSKLSSHDSVVTFVVKELDTYLKWMKADIAVSNTQARQFFTTNQLEKLEVVLFRQAKVLKNFSGLKELFPSPNNEILEDLKTLVSQNVQDFGEKCNSSVPGMTEVEGAMLNMKQLTSTISNPQLAAHVHKEMNNMLNILVEKKEFDFYQLGTQLCARGPLGRDIVEGDNFPQFKSLIITMMNEVTARLKPADALSYLTSKSELSAQNAKLLEKAYEKFESTFEGLLREYLLPSNELDELVNSVRKQVFSLFRILELDVKKWWIGEVLSVALSPKKLEGHLVQIGTGEGKSIILGVLSTVLTLLGFHVSCACYSQYLSERDYNSFKDLFIRFGVVNYIQYSTLSQLAGNYINEQGDIREYTKCFIEGTKPVSRGPGSENRGRVLLIDEVDIFFSRDFYGATYNPSTILKNPSITNILEFIWKNKNAGSSLYNSVRSLEEYKDLITRYAVVRRIIDNAIVRMIDEVKKFNDPPYDRVKNKYGQWEIGYKEGGTVTTSIQHGYRTCFAYLMERDNGNIPNEAAQTHLGLAVNCGQFSYSEVPKEYGILGVTGTLATLGKFEQEVKDTEYGIKKSTFTPSIYGNTQLVFREKDDVFVESETALHQRKIQENIIEKKRLGQAVLVFFETEKKLNEFTGSGYSSGLEINTIKEDTENIDFYMKKATLTGKVTFMPRVFGRGLDFACRDDAVERAGGVHVIQTFLSEDISEEIQIKGRTARQGKKGSYTLILSIKDLVRQFSLTEEAVNEQKKGSKLYEFISKARVEWFERKSAERNGVVERSLELHTGSIDFRSQIKAVVSGDKSQKEAVVRYLEEQNPGIKAKSKTICLSDATGSMASVWRNAKLQIAQMIERIVKIGGSGKSELMWAAYRDYCDEILIENSSWHSDPVELIKFVDKIKCVGGGDEPEAVEMGLKLANDMKDVTRVILIADAPPHMEGKGNMCEYHKRKLETDFVEQANLLAAKHVAVFCFYMNTNKDLVDSFTQIATITGGKAAKFSDTNTLIDVISETVLHDIGGEDLVLEYRKTYHS